MTLKELRMWHWQQAMNHRRLQRLHEQRAKDHAIASWRKEECIGYKKDSATARVHDRDANFHIDAVQALNDVVPGVAEYDCIEADKSNIT